MVKGLAGKAAGKAGEAAKKAAKTAAKSAKRQVIDGVSKPIVDKAKEQISNVANLSLIHI